jgi:uncharacterized protein CbrC (UPF0167 family)
VFVGYGAVRAGYAVMTKDTELGMISWNRAGGVSNIGPSEIDPSDIDQAQIWELLHTPNFISWQGEKWLFSHGRPMIYVGVWSQLEFIMYADDGDGEALFSEVVEDQPAGDLWAQVEPQGPVSVYVFRCPSSGRLRATWDRA